MSLATQKSWSVTLFNGYILNGEVRADHCKGCECATQLILGNNDDRDLLLYGCKGHKCKHVMIRLKFIETVQTVQVPMPLAVTSVAVFTESQM